MEKINDKLLSILSFVIFLINMIKYYLINVEQLIYSYSPQNGLMSLILFPIIIIGLIFSLIVIVKNIFYNKRSILNVILSMPLIIFFIYFFFIK